MDTGDEMFVDITGLRGEKIKAQVPEILLVGTLTPSNVGFLISSGGGTPTFRAIEPWDLPGYVEPAPLPSYLELFT